MPKTLDAVPSDGETLMRRSAMTWVVALAGLLLVVSVAVSWSWMSQRPGIQPIAAGTYVNMTMYPGYNPLVPSFATVEFETLEPHSEEETAYLYGTLDSGTRYLVSGRGASRGEFMALWQGGWGATVVAGDGARIISLDVADPAKPLPANWGEAARRVK